MNPLARSANSARRRSRFRPDALQTEDNAGTRLLALETWGNLTQGLTPNRLKTILAAADAGDILEQHLLFADMEDRCEHLAAEMGKRKRALLTLDWEIVPGKANNAQAEKVAEAVREQVNALDGLEDLLMDMADGIGHGFAALEIEWRRDGSGHMPAAFHFRPQTWFQVLPENRNALRLRDGSPLGQELWPYGWLIHTHRSHSGWLPRYGLFRTIAWAYMIRSFALEANVKYVQIHGLPFRVGKYPAGSTPEDRAALSRALQHIGQDAAGIVPKDCDILFETPANATHDLAGDLVTRCEQGMSKAILGGTLTTQADGKTSTNALGTVHNEVRHDLSTSDAGQIAATITRQILTPLAVLNLGVTDPALLPWFRFDTRKAVDLGALAESLTKLAPHMDISRRWVHEKTRIPRAENPEDRFGAPVATTQTQMATQTHMAALTATGTPDIFPAQTAIDGLPEDPGIHDALADAGDLLLRPVLQAIRHGTDPETALKLLGELYPAMDQAALTGLLTRAFFVADCIGLADKDV